MSTRQRKGKSGQATPSQRGSEELDSSPSPSSREHRGSPSRASSSSGLQWLLWPLLALLAGALGALAWLHLAQRDGLMELGKEVLDLRSKLPRELEGLREQILQDQEDKINTIRDVNKQKRVVQATEWMQVGPPLHNAMFTDETSVALEHYSRRCYRLPGRVGTETGPLKLHVWDNFR